MHYVCQGECGGVSNSPGTCRAEDCSKSGMLLQECNCEDNSHGKHPEDSPEDVE